MYKETLLDNLLSPASRGKGTENTLFFCMDNYAFFIGLFRNCLSRAGIVLLLFPLLLSPLQTAAQNQPDSGATAIQLGLRGHYGFIIPHAREVRGIATSDPWGLDLDLSFHFSSQEAWQYVQAYPRLGATLAYYNFNNPEVLGNAYALLVYAEPFLSAHKKFSLSFRLGGGLAFLTNPHDPETNPENLFYSTPISFPLAANLMANYRLSKSILLRAGANYQHISNGGISQPNKGINFPTLTAGLDYTLQPALFPKRKAGEAGPAKKERAYAMALLGSYTDSPQNDEEHLPLLGLMALASQRIGRLSALTAGAEWVADFALKEKVEQEGLDKDFQRGAALLGHELLIGKFRLTQQLGIYFYSPVSARDAVYQRYGLEFQAGRRLFLGLNLKAHRHVADFFDLRTGLRF